MITDWLNFAHLFSETEEEYLKVRFMRLSKIKLKVLEVHSVDIRFQCFYANLQTGVINIDPTFNTVSENLALVFSIAILHELCSPEKPERLIKSTLGMYTQHQKKYGAYLMIFDENSNF